MTQPKQSCVYLLIGALFIAMFYQPAFAHAGVDHSKNCFLTVGDTRFHISGYQFQPELEGKAHAPYLSPVAKHFCHFFPKLGQVVIMVEPMNKEQDKTLGRKLSILS
jgi:hypothetical protein